MNNIFKTKIKKPTLNAINEVCELLKSNEIVAIPTETVYGLAGDATKPDVIDKIFKAKGRPSDNPLIVHISNLNMLKQIVKTISNDAKLLIDNFWPGPLTLIMPKTDYVCKQTTAGLDSVAVRMPENQIALNIIETSQIALAAPSANISGKPSPTTAQDVFEDLNGNIPLIIDGGECKTGVESTVISMLDSTPIILRPGIITKEDIEQVLNKKILLAKEILTETTANSKVLSPGMKYKHYSPNSEVFLVKGTFEQFANFVNNLSNKNIVAVCFDGEEQFLNKKSLTFGAKDNDKAQAHNIFKVLREIDKLKAEVAYIRCPNTSGIALAVYNRLLRSSGFKVLDLDNI